MKQRQAGRVLKAAPLTARMINKLYSKVRHHSISKILSKQKHHITIVAVGGTVSTILLQSRQSTHDLDFFTEHLNFKASDALRNFTKRQARARFYMRVGLITTPLSSSLGRNAECSRASPQKSKKAVSSMIILEIS